jgi:adenylate cyclase class IV
MAHEFECEVRFKIENITDFEARLNQLGGNIAYSYEFIDYYYKPVGKKWNPVEKNLRIREWINPKHQTTVYFDKLQIISIDGLQFKRSMHSEGKLPLFRNELIVCKSLLEDIGFEFWFSIRKKKARLWEVPNHNFCTAVEYIEGLEWIGELEFEGTEPQKAKLAIENALMALNIPRKLVTYKPISAIYLEHIKADKIIF